MRSRASRASPSLELPPSLSLRLSSPRSLSSPSLPLSLLLCWLLYAGLARVFLLDAFGSQLAGGAPRWRCAFGIPTQLGALPALCGLAARSHAYHTERWVARCTTSGLSVLETSFVYIFAAAMLYDFLAFSMRPVLLAHHVISLLSHIYASTCKAARPAFPFYMVGVCLLEVGSAICSYYWLVAPSRTVLIAFVLTMSLSNLAALVCTAMWWKKTLPGDRVGAYVAAAVSTLLIVGRQLNAHHVLHVEL
eukprot:scaffold80795_cov35-Tisochrysis_lutea.AAC.1